jgi:hypothetical protein
MTRYAALLLVLTLVGCASSKEGEDEAVTRRGPMTLCIENSTAGYGNVNAKARMVNFELMPGETVCKELQEYGSTVPIVAVTRGGGIYGPLRFRAEVSPVQGDCWHWRLTNDRQTVPMHCYLTPGEPEKAGDDKKPARADTTKTE